jgi:hypothetical protein
MVGQTRGLEHLSPALTTARKDLLSPWLPQKYHESRPRTLCRGLDFRSIHAQLARISGASSFQGNSQCPPRCGQTPKLCPPSSSLSATKASASSTVLHALLTAEQTLESSRRTHRQRGEDNPRNAGITLREEENEHSNERSRHRSGLLHAQA